MRYKMKKLLAVFLASLLLLGMIPFAGYAEESAGEVVADVFTPEPAPVPKVDEEPIPVQQAEPENTEAPQPEATIVETPQPTSQPNENESMGIDVTANPETAVPTITTEPATASPAPAAIVSFDVSALPEGKSVPYGTSEEQLDLPSKLKAVWNDGSVCDVSVTWRCIADGNGGQSYTPNHANPEAVFTFEAVLLNGENCKTALPVFYVVYAAAPAPAMIQPLLWKDVFVEVDEKEYETSYKSIVLNVKKTYEFGLSLEADAADAPDSSLKAKIDESETDYNIVSFNDLESESKYTVWARTIGSEEWTAFEDPIKTDRLTLDLMRNEKAVGSNETFTVGENVTGQTNIENPAYVWQRKDQDTPVSQGNAYLLTYTDVGAGLKCKASEGEYEVESREIQVIPPSPSELRLNTALETLTVVFENAVPIGARVVLLNSESVQIATIDVTESGSEFVFENMRARVGQVLKAYVTYNGVNGTSKECTLPMPLQLPEKPNQEEIRFAASSQRSIDFQYTGVAEVEFGYRLIDGQEDPKLISGSSTTILDLSAATAYMLCIRSAASAHGFASDWMETEIQAVTESLTVAVSQQDAYIDDTLTASPAKNYLFATDYPMYRWYYSAESEFNANAQEIQNANCAELDLQEVGISKADVGRYILVRILDGYGNISDAKAIKLHRREDPLLSLDVGERILVGETITATFNGENTNLTWQWSRNDEIIAGADAASYTATTADANCVLTVRVLQNESEVASAYVAVDMCAPRVSVDYEQEKITLSVNGAMPSGWMLRVTDENGAFVERTWPTGAAQMTCALSDVGADPDRNASSAPDYTISMYLQNADTVGATAQIILPTRGAYSGKALDMDAIKRNGAAELSFVVPEGVNIALSAENGSEPDFTLGSGLNFSLKEGTNYRIWLRDAAVAGVSFSGKWSAQQTVKTESRRELSVTLKSTALTWNPDMEMPGINISDSSVSRNDIVRSWYNADGKALDGAPNAAGKYTLRLSLRGTAAKWYKLKESKLSLTIEPLHMTAKNTRVTCEQLSYNGKEQLPQRMKILVDGKEIPADEFKVEKVSGYDCTKAGSHIIKVVGNGNVSGGIKILYVISQAKPAPIAWPTAGYLVSGQTLSESRLSGGSTNAGSFAWETGSVIPSVGISKHNVVFTPADTVNYDWKDITKVKPVEVKVYSVAPPVDSSEGTGYNYDYSASSGYWDGNDADDADENASAQLVEAYLGVGNGSSDTDALKLVYDAMGEPVDYEFLPILQETDDADFAENCFMFIAQPDTDGAIASRSLRFSLAQLHDFRHKQSLGSLIFRNGDAELMLLNDDSFAADMDKLGAYMLGSDADTIDWAEINLDAMDEAVLTAEARSRLWLELRIDPVAITQEAANGESEKDAWDVGLWLCCEDWEVDISEQISGFRIGLNVNGLFDEISRARFLAENTVAWTDENGEMLFLESELKQTPDCFSSNVPNEAECFAVLMPMEDGEEIWTDYTPDMNMNVYRNDVLSVSYAGVGTYMLAEREES